MLFGALCAGLVFGLYFTLVGLGLNLIFGVMKIVNLAHGDFLMLGGFSAYFLFYLLGWHPLLAAVAVLVIFFLASLPIYYLVVPRLLQARDSEMLSVILFFGLSQVIEALAAISFGTTERSIPGRVLGSGPVIILGQRLPSAWVFGAAVSAVAVASVYLYLFYARLGTLTRAAGRGSAVTRRSPAASTCTEFPPSRSASASLSPASRVSSRPSCSAASPPRSACRSTSPPSR